MAIVHRERAHLPDGKALLYDETANAYINTIDSQRKIEPGDALAPFGWRKRKVWLARVGFEMQQRRSAEAQKREKRMWRRWRGYPILVFTSGGKRIRPAALR